MTPVCSDRPFQHGSVWHVDHVWEDSSAGGHATNVLTTPEAYLFHAS